MTTLNDLNVRPKAVQETKTDKYNVYLDNGLVDARMEYDDAMRLAKYYRQRGHTDVIVECVEFNEHPNDFENADVLVSLRIY